MSETGVVVVVFSLCFLNAVLSLVAYQFGLVRGEQRAVCTRLHWTPVNRSDEAVEADKGGPTT